MSAGHAVNAPGFALKPCPACLEGQRGNVTLMPWFVRRVDSDEAFISYQCPRCMFVDEFVVPVPLETISRPAGRIFHGR